jgi:hypothetical protein
MAAAAAVKKIYADEEYIGYTGFCPGLPTCTFFQPISKQIMPFCIGQIQNFLGRVVAFVLIGQGRRVPTVRGRILAVGLWEFMQI